MQPQVERLFSCAVQPIPKKRSIRQCDTHYEGTANRRVARIPELVDMSTHLVAMHQVAYTSL